MARTGYKCQLCGKASGSLQVHHNCYDRLGAERDSDLIVLCRPCHSWHHKKPTKRQAKAAKRRRWMRHPTDIGINQVMLTSSERARRLRKSGIR